MLSLKNVIWHFFFGSKKSSMLLEGGHWRNRMARSLAGLRRWPSTTKIGVCPAWSGLSHLIHLVHTHNGEIQRGTASGASNLQMTSRILKVCVCRNLTIFELRPMRLLHALMSLKPLWSSLKLSTLPRTTSSCRSKFESRTLRRLLKRLKPSSRRCLPSKIIRSKRCGDGQLTLRGTPGSTKPT